MNGVDPANVVGPLFTAELLTRQERQKATQRTSTPTEQLTAIFDALERRVSIKPAYFHTLVEILRSYHNDVAEKIQGKIFAGVDIIVCVLLFLQRFLKMKGNLLLGLTIPLCKDSPQEKEV